jgi:hypothetical protein
MPKYVVVNGYSTAYSFSAGPSCASGQNGTCAISGTPVAVRDCLSVACNCDPGVTANN